jgi:GNAT superfamily N-acetyltransferase
MIRAATVADVPILVELGAQMHGESPRFSRLRYDAEKVRALLSSAVNAPHMLVVVAERDGAIVGGFVGMVAEHWCSRDLIATDLALFIDPRRRGGIFASRLLRAYLDWAEIKGAKLTQAGITTGVHQLATERLYEALGLSRCGSIFEVD